MSDHVVNGPVWVYGGGTFGSALRQRLIAAGIEVRGVIDAKGPTSASPDAIRLSDHEDFSDSDVMVVGIFNHFTPLDEIVETLKSHGVGRLILPPEAARFLHSRSVPLDCYWLSATGQMLPEPSKLSELSSLLTDDSSRKLLDDVMDYRKGTYRPGILRPRDVKHQYCDPEVGFLRYPDRAVIDCGAYNGDSILNWSRQNLECGLIIACEPDPVNYGSLVSTLKSSPGRTLALPLGIGSSLGRASIDGTGLGATLVPDGEGSFTVVSIDEAFGSLSIGLIKMDIEGAEPDAIRGARKTILDQQPDLAISVYHNPADLWEIPLALKEMVPAYGFRLRLYGQQGFDLVLYASTSLS